MISFQQAILDALEDAAIRGNDGAVVQPSLRAIMDRRYANQGTLHVLHDWDEVVRVTFDFQARGATLVFDHEPNTMLGGPKSDRVFHVSPSDAQETRRLLSAWADRIQAYRRNWIAGGR